MNMASSSQIVMVCVLLLTANSATAWEWSDLVAPVVGGTVAVVGAPYALAAAGFGAGGIAAGTLAAKVMSAAWTTGYGVGAVAGLQSAGAAGLTVAQAVVVGAAGAGAAMKFTDS